MPDRLFTRAVLAGHDLGEIRPLAEAHGFALVQSHPEIVICHGGDGTVLGAEREWPGVPKLALRRAGDHHRATDHGALLAAIAHGEGEMLEFVKVEAEVRGERLIGINEILLHNAVATSAVRYRIAIDRRPWGHEIVGDGLVVSTPFGSSGYYRSITHSTFEVGLGLAFNNSTEPLDHLVLRPEVIVGVRVTRGPAVLAADNNPAWITLDRDDEVTIRQHAHPALILRVPGHPHPPFRRHIHPNGHPLGHRTT
ncbi:MAG: NAD(+)/NADH kinase [Candidatus Sumerlaeia bacterium]|nr:NAD(+)/NADH kinase [Candidatus Sumerlaeia bacterium]